MKSMRIIAALLGALSVILGAFGAHGLKRVLTESQLDNFDTGVKYLFLHAIVLLIINSTNRIPIANLKNINKLFLIGIVLFSGTIFLLVSGIKNIVIVYATPVGGLFLILAWLFLAFGYWKSTD